MDISILARYPAIAWDFDLTLVDSPASETLHQFIKQTPAIRHYIVTFRSHGLQHNVFEELNAYPTKLKPRHFSGVFNIDNESWVAFNAAQKAREAGKLSGALTKPELFYHAWKGLVCHTHSIPALVDDKIDHVKLGCEQYGIDFYDPMKFTQ